jgi:hypothetical protein
MISPPSIEGMDSFAYDLATINKELFCKLFANEIVDVTTPPVAEVPA